MIKETDTVYKTIEFTSKDRDKAKKMVEKYLSEGWTFEHGGIMRGMLWGRVTSYTKTETVTIYK